MIFSWANIFPNALVYLNGLSNGQNGIILKAVIRTLSMQAIFGRNVAHMGRIKGG